MNDAIQSSRAASCTMRVIWNSPMLELINQTEEIVEINLGWELHLNAIETLIRFERIRISRSSVNIEEPERSISIWKLIFVSGAFDSMDRSTHVWRISLIHSKSGPIIILPIHVINSEHLRKLSIQLKPEWSDSIVQCALEMFAN